MSALQPPHPPPDLLRYVGHKEPELALEQFERFSGLYHDLIVDLLPGDWSWEGKRVLDFACGPGRVLRTFLAEAQVAEMHGCDIDAGSIAWLEQHLSPPLHVFRNGERPGLPFPDAHFDLIWALSLFSVLADGWSDWLCELHRLLRPGGLLIATFVGEGGSEFVAQEPWDEDRIGMNVLAYGVDWDTGGALVLHSPWWIREHWGRAFEIVELRSRTPWGEGVVVMRPREVRITPADLERVDPGDERELRALRHNLVQAQREGIRVREAHAAQLRALQASWSWRLTRPLRRAAALIERGRREHRPS